MRFSRSLLLLAFTSVSAAAQTGAPPKAAPTKAAPTATKVTTQAAGHLTTPKESMGFDIGADYHLATYTQMMKYWQTLAKESPRMKLDTIGRTAEGRPQLMAVISSPENLAKMETYRKMSEDLGRGRIDSAKARLYAQTGKGIMWIDGGLHADEVLGAAALQQVVWDFVSKNDPETKRILNDIIILATQVNPDGMEKVSSWYMLNPDSLGRQTNGYPGLYEKYAGHDDNRDFYRLALPESQNDSRVMYLKWYPQIVYNHHQTGPNGAIMFAPPFRDPANYFFDPIVPTSLEVAGMVLQRRFAVEGKGGVVSREGSTYSTWWNGGLRTAAYFHNMIGILTETIGSPNPSSVALPTTLQGLKSFQLMNASGYFPAQWGPWHFKQSVDYSMTADRALLDWLSRDKENILFNFWRMGRNSIERGSTDSWTNVPRMMDSAMIAMRGAVAVADPNAVAVPDSTAGRGAAGGRGAGGRGAAGGGRGGAGGGGGRGGGRGGRGVLSPQAAAVASVLRDPNRRDPRAFVIPYDQPEIGNALTFLQALAGSGIEIHKATADFSINGKNYPKGSFVVRSDQAFRPHVLDMFERQDHPMDLQYPGGPPKAPYDNAGYTLAFQMGFQFDRILDAYTAPLVQLPLGTAKPDPAPFNAQAAGWKLTPKSTETFLAVNRLLKANVAVTRTFTGDFLVPAGAAAAKILGDMARDRAYNAMPVTSVAGGVAVKPLKVALINSYSGSMPVGWTRLVFEQFEVPFDLIYPSEIDGGKLKNYDVLVMNGVGLGGGGGRGGGGGGLAGPGSDSLSYQKGSLSAATSLPIIKAFLQNGGQVIAVAGSATGMATALELPLESHLVKRSASGANIGGLTRTDYYIPGSVLQVAVDTTLPAAAGAKPLVDVFFDNSPVWDFGAGAEAKGLKKIAWFASDTPLLSGWAVGQNYLKGGIEMASAPIGKGTVYLYAPEMLFRAQPYTTFRFLFNTMYAPK